MPLTNKGTATGEHMAGTSRTNTARVDLVAIATRFAAATSAMSDEAVVEAVPAAVGAVLADVPLLMAEVLTLRRIAKQARLRAANLAAAGRATLAAQAEGESDPLWYLRDELNGVLVTLWEVSTDDRS